MATTGSAMMIAGPQTRYVLHQLAAGPHGNVRGKRRNQDNAHKRSSERTKFRCPASFVENHVAGLFPPGETATMPALHPALAYWQRFQAKLKMF